MYVLKTWFSVGRVEIISTLSSPEVRRTARSEPMSPIGDAQDHQDMRKGRRTCLVRRTIEGSEETTELPDVIPKCHKTPTVSEIVAHNCSRTPYRNWCRHCVAGRAPNLPHRPRRPDQGPLKNTTSANAEDEFHEKVEGRRMRSTSGGDELPILEASSSVVLSADGEVNMGSSGPSTQVKLPHRRFIVPN